MRKTRLYFPTQIILSQELELEKQHSHYLANVMRRKKGDEVHLFNEQDGEFLCRIEEISKKSAKVMPIESVRESETLPDLSLYFVPIKGSRNNNIIEKATELGVSKIYPVQTEFGMVRSINIEKYQLCAIEASEQSERLSVPEIGEMQPLEKAIEALDAPILFCDETGNGIAITQALEDKITNILIGPEGGFSPSEHKFLQSHEKTIPVTLGPRILRADTAAIAALSIVSSIQGDWK